MISISLLRSVSRDRPDLAEAMFDTIAALDRVNAAHEVECGCPAPSGLWACLWKGRPAAILLSKIDFDEEQVG